MLEVYYRGNANVTKEAQISAEAARFGGYLTYREDSPSNVVLTFEFDDEESAEQAAPAIRGLDVHVEGPTDYGPFS